MAMGFPKHPIHMFQNSRGGKFFFSTFIDYFLLLWD